MAYFILIIIILTFFFLWTTHKGAPLISVSSTPLTAEEIQELALIRRRNKIAQYYRTSRLEIEPNKEFKKKMNGTGQWHQMVESENELGMFPAIAAALLKHKKYEWIIIALEKDKRIVMFWANHTSSKSSVYPTIDYDHLVESAAGENYTSILIFHNHPNSNPALYRTNEASYKDHQVAAYLSQKCNTYNINLAEYVCERGRSYRYHRTIADTFFPLTNIQNEIEEQNNQSPEGNQKLRREIITWSTE